MKDGSQSRKLETSDFDLEEEKMIQGRRKVERQFKA